MQYKKRKPKRFKGSRYNIKYKDMEEGLSLNDWIKWAEATDNMGVANVEPIIVDFLKDTCKETNIFAGKQWDGKNWLDVSVKFRRILKDNILDENPSKYTLPGIIGQSVLKSNYPGIKDDYLEEALTYVSETHWAKFLNSHTFLIKDHSSYSRMQIIRFVLVGLVRLYIPNENPAKTFKEYLQNKGLIP